MSSSCLSSPRHAQRALSSSSWAICGAEARPPRAAAWSGVSPAEFRTRGSKFLLSSDCTAAWWLSSTATCRAVAPSTRTGKSTSPWWPQAPSKIFMIMSVSRCGRAFSSTATAPRASAGVVMVMRLLTEAQSRISAILMMSMMIRTLTVCGCLTFFHRQARQRPSPWPCGLQHCASVSLPPTETAVGRCRAPATLCSLQGFTSTSPEATKLTSATASRYVGLAFSTAHGTARPPPQAASSALSPGASRATLSPCSLTAPAFFSAAFASLLLVPRPRQPRPRLRLS
mmetsp:Transcript_99582/g.257331  ORF Transcript_99582/g.257331 Transcript_99582/m.257331 type:complete len:285 (+) Transcript_99582:1581-2435(+)